MRASLPHPLASLLLSFFAAFGSFACAPPAAPLPPAEPGSRPDLPRSAESNPDAPIPDEPSIPWRIRSGTSFGMCAGWCATDAVWSGATKHLLLTRRTRGGPVETKGCFRAPNPSEPPATPRFTDAELAAITALPPIVGCPDCADGGAEYLELQRGTKKVRVTFEAGASLPGLERLLELVRKEREAFGRCGLPER
ncbi:MAG: hypothetical protein JST00_33680 [Deltaproteobacteria bacterium]|nr:hypothetical protein [Deltaproteobacteria bacterium]